MAFGNELRGMGVNNTENTRRKVKVFDVANKKLLKECNSLHEAAEFTGVDLSNIIRFIKRKGRSSTNKLGIVICFR